MFNKSELPILIMSFISASGNLGQVRGTTKYMSRVGLTSDTDTPVVYKYVNSGIWRARELDKSKLDFETLFDKDEDPSTFFQQGRRFAPTLLNMPANCLEMSPHFHPGGEFAYVAEGSYFDADMNGGVIAEYPQGSTVLYRKGSSHRPLSGEGAKLLYIAFDGVVFGKNPLDLIAKMDRIKTPGEAIEYAAMWMIPDREERAKALSRINLSTE
jgi:hypothetical protein